MQQQGEQGGVLMTHATYADIFRPGLKRYALYYDIALILSGALIIALSAQIAIPLPFSPVPITGQTFSVLLTGALLGSKRGSLAVITYLAEGAIGFPVFAGGKAGILNFLGPTGGYLIGFIVAAFITGLLAERGWDRRVWTTFLAMLFGNIAIYMSGLLWLFRFVGIEKLLPLGFYPFIPGDVLKLTMAAILLPTGWRLLKVKGEERGK